MARSVFATARSGSVAKPTTKAAPPITAARRDKIVEDNGFDDLGVSIENAPAIEAQRLATTSKSFMNLII
jgi:hypothetical protein